MLNSILSKYSTFTTFFPLALKTSSSLWHKMYKLYQPVFRNNSRFSSAGNHCGLRTFSAKYVLQLQVLMALSFINERRTSDRTSTSPPQRVPLPDKDKFDEIKTKSTEALMELMHTINFCIIEISQQYKQCLEKQIKITSSVDISDECWDDLIRCRVEAEELMLEFNKYKLLVHKVEQFVFSHSVKHLMTADSHNLDMESLNQEYNTLLRFLENLDKENKELENKLLVAKRNSIIQGLKIEQ